MINTINRSLQVLRDRIYLLVGRAHLSDVDDHDPRQRLQMTALKGEVKDQVERIQEYGFTSVPLPGAQIIFLSLAGNRDHPIAIAVDDPRYRLHNLAPGEVALYTDEGDHIILRRGRRVEISTNILVVKAAGKARFETPVLEVTGDIIDRAGSSGQSMKAMRDLYNSHTHPENDFGGPTGTPNQSMGGSA